MSGDRHNRPPADFTRPELSLLFCAARATLSSDDRASLLALLDQPLDWNVLLTAAARHGVWALLHTHVEREAADRVPEQVMTTLREAVRGYEPYARERVHDLLGLMDGFRAAGLSVIPYKGPVLSQRLYGHWAMRQFSDLDFLVRRGDARRAGEFLVEKGFRVELGAPPGWESWYERARHESAFRNPAGLYVELHWGAWQRFVSMPVAVDPFWDRLETVAMEGRSVPSLRMEDLLFFLCLHGTKHQWNRLAWLADCAEIIRSTPGLDWARVIALAEAGRSARFVWIGLRLGQRLMGVALPPEVQARVDEDARAIALAGEMEVALRSGVLREAGEGEHLRFMFRALPRHRDRLRFLWGLAAEPCRDDWAYCRLPPALAGLYAVIRPWRLFWKSAARRV